MEKKLSVIAMVMIIICIIFGFVGITIKNNENAQKEKEKAEEPKTENQIQVDVYESEIQYINTMSEKIEKNTVWSAGYEILKNNDYDKKLKQSTAAELELPKDIYYLKYDKISDELIGVIKSDVMREFNTDVATFDNFKITSNMSKTLLVYLMLNQDIQFKYKFDDLADGKFKNATGIKYFGIDATSNFEIASQIEVLYYNSPNSFAIKIEGKNDADLVFVKSPKGDSFDDIYDNIKKANQEYDGIETIDEGEYVKIPYISLSNVRKIQDKIDNVDVYSDFNSVYMIEDLKYTITKAGGQTKTIVSKPKVDIYEQENTNRTFYLDSDFAVFILDSKTEVPYLCINVSDITKFQE